MGWQLRRKKHYYYTAKRVGLKVVKTYLGRKESADLAAQIDGDNRRRRAVETAALAAEKTRMRTAEKAANQLEVSVELLIEATLLGAGYRQHSHGSWRKPRPWKAR